MARACLPSIHPQEKTGIPDSDYTLVKPFGSCDTEVCFEQEQEDFIAAVNTLDANTSGMDASFQESQTVALVRAAEDWAWRAGVLKVFPERLFLPRSLATMIKLIALPAACYLDQTVLWWAGGNALSS